MKYLLMLDTPVWLFLSIFLGIKWFRTQAKLNRLVDPLRELSRKQRRTIVQRRLAQADEDKDLEQFERNLDIIQGNRKETR